MSSIDWGQDHQEDAEAVKAALAKVRDDANKIKVRRRSIVGTGSGALVVLLIAAVIAAGGSGSTGNQSAKDFLLAVSKLPLVQPAPGPGQYLQQRSIERALTTNGRQNFNQFTIVDTFLDDKGSSAGVRTQISAPEPVGAPLPTGDLVNPPVDSLNPYAGTSAFVNVKLPEQLNGDIAADRNAIDNEVNLQMQPQGANADRTFETWFAVTHLLVDDALTSSARVAVFQIAATLPGLTANANVTDSLNRAGTQISSTGVAPDSTASLIFDTRTGQVLELRTTNTDAHEGPLGVTDSVVYLSPTVVDSVAKP